MDCENATPVTVYFISGLAADRSIFKNIQLPPHCKAVHLDWIQPLPNEPLAAYAQRLAEKIDTTEKFALIGLSLGGMLAVEIATQLQPLVVILLSSIPTVQHLPVYFHLAGRLRLHKAVPVWLIQRASLLKRLFTSETAADKKLLKQMIRKSDARFIKWSMNAVLNWKHTGAAQNLVHIHGTKDEIFPLRYTKPTHLISGGRHLMVLNRAAEINQILAAVLAKEAFVRAA